MKLQNRSSRWGLMAIVIIALLPLLTVRLGAQSDLTGFWVFRVPTGDGNFRESFFDIKQEGATITGKAFQGTREIPLSEGSFRDGQLHFVVSFTAGNPPQPRVVTYDGSLEGDKIALTSVAAGRDPIQGTLERSRPEATLPPPRLPIPELRDVPDNGLARTPPMGWNSWNLFACRGVNDAVVRGIADAMVSSGMKKAGYLYVNIDDCWEGAQRDANGNITTNTKFPDMKALADYVHSKGLKIGIYSSPGPKTCAGYEGSYGHEEQDAKTFAAWGIDYLKYDWCSASRIYKDEEMQAVYQKMGEALRQTGRPIVYSLCQYGRNEVWKWGAKVSGNLWRTTGDIRDTWQSMERIGFRQFDISPHQQPGHWNDPDMLEIGNGGMTADEYRTHMSLWSMLAAPLLAGNDLRKMTPETVEILTNKEVIAIDQDPLGKPVQRISVPGAPAAPAATAGSPDTSPVVLTRPLRDGSMAIALFNRAAEAQTISLNWSSVGFAGKELRARDLWKHAEVKLSGDSYSATVPTHGVVLLKVRAR